MVDGIAQKPLGDQQPTKALPFLLWMRGVQVPTVHLSRRSAVALTNLAHSCGNSIANPG
jgi:hypothetical protein